MGQQWYYTQSGAQAGPVTTDVLRQMFAAGQLSPDELVWADGMPDWQPARNVPTFFAPQQQPHYNPQQQAYAGPAGAFPSPYATAPGAAPINYYSPQQQYVQYAGFWLRFCAAFIDGIILFVVNFIVGFIFGFAAVAASGGGHVDPSVNLLVNLIGIVIGWLYEALQESSAAQATLGKRAVGIIVTDSMGNRITFARATGRHFAKFISGLILLIGYLMAAFTQKKQALHDMMADTLVVQKTPQG